MKGVLAAAYSAEFCNLICCTKNTDGLKKTVLNALNDIERSEMFLPKSK